MVTAKAGVPTLKLTFSDGQSITTTAAHPFYVDGKGFTPAGRLAVGNAIVTRAGPPVKVMAIEQEALATVYNLTVDGDHTYFVGDVDGGVWVHNVSCKGRLKAEKLPTKGGYRFVPPRGYNPRNPLPRSGRGFLDRFGNIWQQGPNHHFPDINDPATNNLSLRMGCTASGRWLHECEPNWYSSLIHVVASVE